MEEQMPVQNMNNEIWRQSLNDPLDPGNYYAPSVFVVGECSIGIEAGGRVRVMEPRQWIAVADELANLRAELAAARQALAAAQAERDAARERSASLWRCLRAYRGQLRDLIRDVSAEDLYPNLKPPELWAATEKDADGQTASWSRERRAER